MRNSITEYDMKILILSCPKSGSKYISHYFNEIGISVGHEKRSRHGWSNWLAVFEDESPPYGESTMGALKESSIILHQIRNPFNCISSMLTITKNSINYMCKHLGINGKRNLSTCVRLWVLWNKRAELLSKKSYRIEDWKKNKNNVRHEIFELLGIEKENFKPSKVSTNINTNAKRKEYKKITMKDIKKKTKDSQLIDSFIEMCSCYGYSVKK